MSRSSASQWDVVPLGSLVNERGISYGVVQPGSLDPNGIPIVRVNNLRQGRITRDDVLRVSPEIEQKHLRTRLRGGEVLLSLVGSLGEVALVPPELAGWNVARAVGVIPVADELDPRWVSICLRSADVQKLIHDWATTTVQATLNLRDVGKLPILMPPSGVRHKITEIISALEDKIELNRQMNQTLEQIAAALFRSWFIDFDPVRAKMAGRAPEGMDAATAALFPERLVDSELGEIPEGWEVGDVYRAATVIYGAPFASSKFNEHCEGTPLLRIRDLSSHSPKVFTTEDHPKSHLVRPGELVVGMDGEFRVHLWKGPEVLLNQRVCSFQPRPGFSTAFIRNSIKAPLAFFEGTKSGTTVIHLGKSDIDTFRLVLPPYQLLVAFAAITDPIDARIVQASQETRTLTSLRDTLLPRLLSGELRVAAGVTEALSSKASDVLTGKPPS